MTDDKQEEDVDAPAPSPSGSGLPSLTVPTQVAPATTGKRKRRANGEDSGSSSPVEPRRLRRSHEACSRCRSKKIKCDSKHPRCSACVSANVPCQQEDRHRQMLTPRGHTELLERQLSTCEALLSLHIPGFNLDRLEDTALREGVYVGSANNDASNASQGIYQSPSANTRTASFNNNVFRQPVAPQRRREIGELEPSVRGQDPNSNDLSADITIAQNFGVPINNVRRNSSEADSEDLAVGSGGLSSGRDYNLQRDPSFDSKSWFTAHLRKRSSAAGKSAPKPSGSSHFEGVPDPDQKPLRTSSDTHLQVLLPQDRDYCRKIVSFYFDRLNRFRPTLNHADTSKLLDDLYDHQDVPYDPGVMCSLYLMLSLGTLSERSHKAKQYDAKMAAEGRSDVLPGGVVPQQVLLPPDWPGHELFFQLALGFKSELRVTISSLQALILLHWYLYTERQGRSLWRLVGSLVRLAVELGLHHDPTRQEDFQGHEDEIRDRINLWWIVMIHDRGTSLLLGRPLGIAPNDSNTPHPVADGSVSDHFLHSAPIADIQADICVSLYGPTKLSAEQTLRQATRIIKQMTAFRKQLPHGYQCYFAGTESWSDAEHLQMLQNIREDAGLTLLKLGIARILLLRAVFVNPDLDMNLYRIPALTDAVIVSHNVIMVHNQLLKYPDTAFFVSPIPLHIAAMVILFAQMTGLETLRRSAALVDVWMALDMLPNFRWRWDRTDLQGEIPIVMKVAKRVFGLDFPILGPPNPPRLIPEQDWENWSPSTLSSPAAVHTTVHVQPPAQPHVGQQHAQSPYATPVTPSGYTRAMELQVKGERPTMVNGGAGPPASVRSDTHMPEMTFNDFRLFWPIPNQSGIRRHSGSENGDHVFDEPMNMVDPHPRGILEDPSLGHDRDTMPQPPPHMSLTMHEAKIRQDHVRQPYLQQQPLAGASSEPPPQIYYALQNSPHMVSSIGYQQDNESFVQEEDAPRFFSATDRHHGASWQGASAVDQHPQTAQTALSPQQQQLAQYHREQLKWGGYWDNHDGSVSGDVPH